MFLINVLLTSGSQMVVWDRELVYIFSLIVLLFLGSKMHQKVESKIHVNTHVKSGSRYNG